MSTLSAAKRAAYWWTLLALLALACGAPYKLNGVSTARSGAYWACATPTPEDPGMVEVTPTPAGTPYWVTACFCQPKTGPLVNRKEAHSGLLTE